MTDYRDFSLPTGNLSTLCRLCLSTEGRLYHIFRIDEIETLAVTLPMKVTMFTSIKISKNDMLPRKICNKCLNQINEWYNFKKVCLKSDAALKKYVKHSEEQKAELEKEIVQMNETVPTNEKFRYFDIDFSDIDINEDVMPSKIENSINNYSELSSFEPDIDMDNDEKPTLTDLDDVSVNKPSAKDSEYDEENNILEDVNKESLLMKNKEKFDCNLCPDSFYHTIDLKRHMMVIHKQTPIKGIRFRRRRKLVANAEKISHTRVRARYEMKCNSCNKTYFSKAQFRHHYHKEHPGEKPFSCEICGKKDFISEETLKRHKMLHSGKYRCYTCGKTFTCNAILVIHIRDKHENDKPFICDVCGKRFVTELLMKYHKRFHTGEKKYVCEECGLAVVTSSSLAKHKRTHSLIKPHICKVCEKGFITKGRLVEHFRIHTGERPYTCDICNKGFAMKDKLKRHCRTHSGEKLFSCEYCGNNYSTSYGLSVHLKSQTTHS